MNTPNELEEVTLALPDLALGILPAAEAERLMAIVRLNPRLQAELAALRAASSALASATPVVRMSPDRKREMRARLLARATGNDAVMDAAAAGVPSPPAPVLRVEANDTPTAPSLPATPPAQPAWLTRVSPLLALAATALFVVSLLRLRETQQERNDARAALQAATAQNTALAAQVARSDSLVAAMSGASVRVVELASTQNMSPGARMFWDRVANRWTLITHDLAPAPAGRTYQLWLVTAKAEKISAGTFNTDARGRAVVQATYALTEADLAAIAITEEPTGGSAQPTGPILVAGAATQ